MRKSKHEGEIARLTRAGWSQQAIMHRLGCSRDTVYRCQKKLHLTGKRHGPRCPEPTPGQRRAIFKLLGTGMGTARIAKVLGLTQHVVRRESERANFRHKRGPGQRTTMTDAERAEIRAAIMRRADHALNLAQHFHRPYKTILKMCHEVWGDGHFSPGQSWPPLSSALPQRYFPQGVTTFDDFVEMLRVKVFGGSLPEFPERICAAVMATIPMLKAAPLLERENFALGLRDALRNRILADTLAAVQGRWVN